MYTPTAIKDLLKNWISQVIGHAPSDVTIDELCIVDKTCRADVVHANGRLCGFEVKSAADSLKRWPHQMHAYLKVFDEVWLCCHPKHAPRALAESHASVGIVIADDHGALAVLRPARVNRLVNAFDLSGLLWRGELDKLCLACGEPVDRSEKIIDARHRVSRTVPLPRLKSEVLMRLKERYGPPV